MVRGKRIGKGAGERGSEEEEGSLSHGRAGHQAH